MTTKTAIVWFRQDLRLHDNSALLHAINNHYKILPIYILDNVNSGDWKMGGASRWWLHQSLQTLNISLKNHLQFYEGPADKVLETLIKDNNVTAVFWNRCYEPWRVERDKHIKASLQDDGIEVESFNAFMLWEPWQVLKDDGTPYKVFTPFYRKGCLSRPDPREPEAAATSISYASPKKKTALDDLQLMPSLKWYKEMAEVWTPGEDGAKKRLQEFLKSGLKGYKIERNRPDFENVSRLSPHLHFGEISPREVWHKVRSYGIAHHLESDTDTFCSELGWREFSNSLLYYNPDLPEQPLQKKFKDYPWARDDKSLTAWQRGQTGIPIVDAGMRQLWRTGWMHNRVRMIVGSFLVKNLRVHWREGENWFWDTLVDADLANNAASWQWVAGSGADASPYFRIFNPITQGEKFDPAGDYVRTFVPELKNLSNDYIHKPWDAPPMDLKEAGITLGKDYPMPIVDLKESRDKALDGYKMIKGHAA